jgi:dTDP-4-dehydrorhamnose 3,5-epimerase
MQVEAAPLAGVFVVTPKVHRDPRGYFAEAYHEPRYRDAGMPARFVQDNRSQSQQHTLRGLHAQLKRPQAKLVYCVQGSIWDAVVDARVGSPSFGQWFGVELSAENAKQIYVPEGFVHGFAVLSPTALVEYKCSDIYDAGDQLTVRWDDPDLGVAWPVKDPILSDKDRVAPRLKELTDVLPRFKA